jgi:hypothetical protein
MSVVTEAVNESQFVYNNFLVDSAGCMVDVVIPAPCCYMDAPTVM